MFGRRLFDRFSKHFDDGFWKDFDKEFSEIEKMMTAGISITNNNGHVVIVGPLKSLNVNGNVVDVRSMKQKP